MNWLGLYAQKIISLHSLAKTCGTTADELCAKYGDQTFGDVQKQSVFRNALTGRFAGEEALYLIRACNIKHQKDNRTPLQYATDLIIGWLSEDAIIHALQTRNINPEMIGADKDRQFLDKNDISHSADISIKNQKIELVFDYTNHWKIHDKLDLRDNKKLALEQNSILLFGIAPRANSGFLIRPSDLTDFSHNHIPAYGKDGWTKTGISKQMESLAVLLDKFEEII